MTDVGRSWPRREVEQWPAIRSLGSALIMVVLAACKGTAHEPHAQHGSAGDPSAGSGSAVAATANPNGADAASVDAGLACVPRGKVLATLVEKRLRICSDEKKVCVDADPETGALATAAYAQITPSPLAAAKVEKRDKGWVACFKDKCRDIGKNARDVLSRDPDLRADQLLATTDLGALVIPKVAPQLWDIGADKELKLRPPSGEKDIGQMMPVGDHVFVSWLPAAEAMYCRCGALVASLFSDGTQLAMLDDTRSVALTPDHRVLIFGEPEHTIELGPSVGNYDDWVQEPGALAILGDGTIAVVIERAPETQVILVDPQRGTVFRRWPLPRCPG